MAKLHHEPANVGDRVYDLTRGFGEIAGVSDVIEVRFPTGIRIQYNDNGVPLNRSIPQLYWRNPIIVAPTKNDDTWEAVEKIVRNTVQTVRWYFGDEN